MTVAPLVCEFRSATWVLVLSVKLEAGAGRHFRRRATDLATRTPSPLTFRSLTYQPPAATPTPRRVVGSARRRAALRVQACVVRAFALLPAASPPSSSMLLAVSSLVDCCVDVHHLLLGASPAFGVSSPPPALRCVQVVWERSPHRFERSARQHRSSWSFVSSTLAVSASFDSLPRVTSFASFRSIHARAPRLWGSVVTCAGVASASPAAYR